MADTKTSDEVVRNAAQLTGAELIRIADGGTNYATSVDSIKTYANIAVGNTWNLVENYAAGFSIGNEETDTLATLNVNLAQQATLWPLSAAWALAGGAFTPDVNVNTPAYMAWMEAMLTLRDGPAYLKAIGRAYMIGKVAGDYIPIPGRNEIAGTSNNQLCIKISGEASLLKIIGSGIQDMFVTPMADQTQNDLEVTTKKMFEGLILRGNGNAASKGIRQCANKNGSFKEMKIHNFGTGLELRSNQTTKIEKVDTYDCAIGHFAGVGDWTGAGTSNTNSQPYYDSCAARVPSSGVGFYLDRADAVHLDNCSNEGSVTANYGVYTRNVNDAGSPSTTAKQILSVKNYRIEQHVNFATFGVRGRDIGGVTIDGVESINAECLVELTNESATNHINLLNISDDYGLLRNKNVAGNGGSWNFCNCFLRGNPANVAAILSGGVVFDTSGSYTAPDVSRLVMTNKFNP